MILHRKHGRRTRVAFLMALFGCFGVMVPASAHAACYTVNVTYFGREIPVATSCRFNYQHGNVFASAYSKIQRLPRPAGFPAYCSQAGTRVTGTGFLNGGIAKSTSNWAQSTRQWTDIIYSRTYAYSGSAVDYYREDNSPFC